MKISVSAATATPEVRAPLAGVPILGSLRHGIPFLKSPAIRPTDSFDDALLSNSWGSRRELGIWKVYNAAGEVLATSQVIRGRADFIDGNAILAELVRFWNLEIKKPRFFEMAIALTFTHTHPGATSDPLFSPTPSRFSGGDRQFARAMGAWMRGQPGLAEISFEMHVLYSKDTERLKPDRIGYRVY